MTNLRKSLGQFADICSQTDDLSGFVAGVMKHFDSLKESGQRSEIEIGLENWMNPETEEA